MTFTKDLPEPANVLYRIRRGLSGYVSYLAACEMNESFSEYILYEPILRILTARNYSVKCEVVCPGVKQPVTGDRKRLDLVADNERGSRFAMEVKWAKRRTLDVEIDREKLDGFLNSDPGRGRAFLCVFGTESNVNHVKLTPDCFKSYGRTVIADLRKTKYGCCIFELRNASKVSEADVRAGVQ